MRHVAKIRAEDVEKLRRELEDVPAPHDEDLSKKQAIESLAPQLRALLGKGHSFRSLAETLGQGGLAINPMLLASYLREVDGHAAGSKRKSRRTRRRQRERSEHGSSEVQTQVASGSKAADLEIEKRGTPAAVEVPATITVGGMALPPTPAPGEMQSAGAAPAAARSRTPKVPDAPATSKAGAADSAAADGEKSRKSAFTPKPDTRDI